MVRIFTWRKWLKFFFPSTFMLKLNEVIQVTSLPSVKTCRCIEKATWSVSCSVRNNQMDHLHQQIMNRPLLMADVFHSIVHSSTELWTYDCTWEFHIKFTDVSSGLESGNVSDSKLELWLEIKLKQIRRAYQFRVLWAMPTLGWLYYRAVAISRDLITLCL